MWNRRSVMTGTAAALGAAAAGAKPTKTPFVRVAGTGFLSGGKPYRYAGTNIWYGPYLGSAGALGHRDRLKRELDTLHGFGLDNLRILASGETSPLKNSLATAIQTHGAPDNAALLKGLDFTLAEMGKRGMKAVLFLNNFWEWSGGMVTYQYWTNGGHYIDLGDPAHPWPEFADYSAQFYASPKAVALYHDYVRRIVNRTNSVSGIPYKNDPAIMAWQLANEPRPGGTTSKAPWAAYYAWIAASAGLIKQLDPHHLVSTGNEGVMGCLESENCVTKANTARDIDYVTFHMWPLNWSWIDPKNLDATFESGLAKCRAYIDTHIKLALALKKPLVLEEFGFPREGGGNGPDIPTTHRDRFYRMVYDAVEESAKAGGPFAGTNFWAWGGAGRALHPDFMMKPGDTSYVGDPPQEPQGANSVFDTDAATIAVIKAHVATLKKL
jgi:mannan endo-1,4-beta-mannosidase